MGKAGQLATSPMPGIPLLSPRQPQQPGEVLLGYEVEMAGGCQLNWIGWCCFGALLVTLPPLSWLPFVSSSFRRKAQRPLYGWPMVLDGSFLAAQAAAAVADAAAKAEADSVVVVNTVTPRILCVDASLTQPRDGCADQLVEPLPSEATPPQQGMRPAGGRASSICASPALAAGLAPLRCSASPTTMGIFVPPSAVPACGFTADNPFPVRCSPLPRGVMAACGSPSMPGSPRPPLSPLSVTAGPVPSSPLPSAGLSLMGAHAVW